MTIIRAGAPASVAAVACLLAATATAGLALTGTPGEALTAFGMTAACAHACASRKAADSAVAALRSAMAIGDEMIRHMISLAVKMATMERQIDAMKAELAATPAAFDMPEIANGR